MGLLGPVLSGLSALAQWGLRLFGSKNTSAAVKAAEAAQDEGTLKKADGDLAKGDVKELGQDIGQ